MPEVLAALEKQVCAGGVRDGAKQGALGGTSQAWWARLSLHRGTVLTALCLAFCSLALSFLALFCLIFPPLNLKERIKNFGVAPSGVLH